MRKLSERELDNILCQHKKWRESGGMEGKKADLRSTDLRGADLQGADLRGADLQGLNLQHAYLGSADLRDADLRGTNLRKAAMYEATLCNADLRGANLQEAIISTNKVPSLLGNVLVTKIVDDVFGTTRISKWIEISDEDLELYKELYSC